MARSTVIIRHVIQTVMISSLLSLIFQFNANAALREAQYAQIDYDVVYVRCPRAKEPVIHPGLGESLLNWNGANDIWLSAANNIYQEPGCDLVLHHSDPAYSGGLPAGDPGREEVLVDCNEDDATKPICTVADPNVSFDGRSIIYAKFTDTRTFVGDIRNGFNGLPNDGGWGQASAHQQSLMRIFPDGDGPGGTYAERITSTHLQPYDAPALIFRYDLDTKSETQVSPAPEFWAGRAYPNVDSEWHSNIPVMDTGPFFLPDGRIGFTSNRASGFYRFELMAMDADGKDLEKIGWRAMNQQLHPAILMDGRIMYTSFDAMLQKVQNNNYSLFTINPDDSNPFILAGKHDPTAFTYHFATQLSDGDIVTAIYYDHNNGGMGTLLRFPIDPPGPDFEHQHFRPGVWDSGVNMKPFARVGEFTLTPESSAGDAPAKPYSDPADYWIHPYDGHTVTMHGRFTHPAAAPDNDLLVTYAIGGASTMGSYGPPLSTVQQTLGKDAGIWLIPLEPNSQRQVGHIADDARIIVDFPQYQEVMARPVVPYSRIYGINQPAVRPVTPDQGNQDPRLKAGEPFGLSGAASLYDRETTSLNGTPWNMKDGGGVMSGRTYMNLATSGADLAIYDNSEIYGIRVLLPIPNYPNGISGGTERYVGIQKHALRILGEFPVRKPDGTPLDGQGNPDTSFIVKIPANTPFLFQTLDKRGMALDIETTSRNVAPGEQQLCSGCHVHTREGMDPYQSSAKLDTSAPFGDFSGKSAPLFDSNDANGNPVVKTAQAIYGGTVPGVESRRSFAVDWINDVAPIIQQRCAACHAEGQSAQQLTGLRLDGTSQTYDLLINNQYTREDGTLITANTKPGDGLTDIDAPGTDRITPRYSCCTASRWVSLDSARSSMLVWALYGARLDGRDNTNGLPPAGSGVLVDPFNLDHPEIWPKVGEHAAYVSGMPESEKRLIARWLDIGAPRVNVQDDLLRPVMTLTPAGGTGSINSVLVGVWDDSAIDYSRFKVTANGVDITPAVTGTPDVISVVLPTPVTPDNADSLEYTFEIWDKPDRSLDVQQPTVQAANRTRMTVTGRALLRMANASSNHGPTATHAAITAEAGVASEGVIPSVSDPDLGDSHLYSIISQPAHGAAQVVNNRLVYTSDAGYLGPDSFTYQATDLAGASVEGTAAVTVVAASSNGSSSVTTSSKGGIGPLDPLWIAFLAVYARLRRSRTSCPMVGQAAPGDKTL
jgi:hypothetical protein